MVNANSQIGAGHLKRCLNIARELSKSVAGDDICFLSWTLDAQFATHLELFAHHVVAKEDILRFLGEHRTQNAQNSVVIIDSDDYLVNGPKFQDKLANIGLKSVYFTVDASHQYQSDLLVNPSILALYQQYRVSSQTRCLFGPKYMIFGELFRNETIRPKRSFKGSIFINFGAADPLNYTLKVVRAIQRNKKNEALDLKVVMGGLSQGYSELVEFSKTTAQNIEVYHDVDNIKDIMSQCQLAICSPGTTFWELAVLGIPAILLSSTAREVESAEILNKQRFAKLLHHWDDEFTANTENELNEFLRIPDRIGSNLSELQKAINPDGLKLLVSELSSLFHK